MEVSLTPIIKDSFLQFSGAVLQSRALPDARDILKPSARQIFYCLYTDKFVHEKPFQKTLKAIGSCFRVYIHGDSSAEGVIMRAGQPFAMRYPLIEVEGSYGTLLASGSWSAPRYTAARLSELANYLFADIGKNTIEEWRDNYDNTEKYPMALPSKGYYNICNGSYGIGVGASCSIPQYNLRELNEALIKLLWNPNISFDEIYCVPDFATGAILLNPTEVKESHRKGNGSACKLRAVIEWNQKERCLIVSEIPYMLYTETVCQQLEDIINGEENPGIDRFNDLTGKTPLIKIYLTKSASPEKVLKYLYKNTSLQTFYPINFTVLENGRYPKVFTWKELLQSHLDHERAVYIRGFEFDLNKIRARLHIIDGLLKAINMIDEVVRTIKQSSDTRAANVALQSLLSIDEAQAKAILDIKLSRLAHLEINKLENEKTDLEKEATRIESILNDETLLKKEIENGLREVATKFGDARRTQIMDLQSNEDGEVIEQKSLIVNLTNYGNIYTNEQSTLITQRRGGTGSKMKLQNGECVIESVADTNLGTLMAFSNLGKSYSYPLSDLPLNTFINVSEILKLADSEYITNITSFDKASASKFIIFVTKNGLVKKTAITEYKTKTGRGSSAIKLREGDSLCKILFLNDEDIGLLTARGQFMRFSTSDITPVGKIAMGVQGTKLNDGDKVIDAQVIDSSAREIVSLTSDGMISRTPLDELPKTNRNVKGTKLHKVIDGERLVGFLPANDIMDVVATTGSAAIRFSTREVALTSKGSLGVKALKLKAKEKATSIFSL